MVRARNAVCTTLLRLSPCEEAEELGGSAAWLITTIVRPQVHADTVPSASCKNSLVSITEAVAVHVLRVGSMGSEQSPWPCGKGPGRRDLDPGSAAPRGSLLILAASHEPEHWVTAAYGVHLSTSNQHPESTCPPIHLSIHPPTHPPVHLSVHPPAHPLVRQQRSGAQTGPVCSCAVHRQLPGRLGRRVSLTARALTTQPPARVCTPGLRSVRPKAREPASGPDAQTPKRRGGQTWPGAQCRDKRPRRSPRRAVGSSRARLRGGGERGACSAGSRLHWGAPASAVPGLASPCWVAWVRFSNDGSAESRQPGFSSL